MGQVSREGIFWDCVDGGNPVRYACGYQESQNRPHRRFDATLRRYITTNQVSFFNQSTTVIISLVPLLHFFTLPYV